MKWLLTYLTSSIGKKQVMGATGCILLLFVLGHMVGNLQLLYHTDPADAQAAFNTYSYLLTKFKALLYVVEACLTAIIIIHLYLAITLKLQNYKARGTARYAVDARKGKKQFPSFFMIWTGLAIISFLIWHIYTIRLGEYSNSYYYYINPEVADGVVVRDIWLSTIEILGNPLFAVFYITTMVLLGFHLWHAISSAFQTMGINHHKWTPIIDKLAIVYCVVVAAGFGTTAAGSYIIVNIDEKAKAIIEQSKDTNYQEALKTLNEKPLDVQRMNAKKISENPEKAKLIVERENLWRGMDGKKFCKKDRRGKFRNQAEDAELQPEAEAEATTETEGGEQ
jgi:succinate dehydrogenase / fumarate reductase cytochrome b subunit